MEQVWVQELVLESGLGLDQVLEEVCQGLGVEYLVLVEVCQESDQA